MKNLLLLSSVIIACCYCCYIANAQVLTQKDAIRVNKLWETPDLLTTSESVCYDKQNEVLYVSCINGNPVEKDNNGFIAMLSLNGDIILLNWITGLNAPKGMSISGNKLYVTDIDELVEINITDQKISNKFFVDDAKFLNDITIDMNGYVYVSDYSTSKIHRLKKGNIETWLHSADIINPNGLFYEDEKIIVGTSNGIFSVQLDNRQIWQLIDNTGNIDGITAAGNAGYLISDWSGKVRLVTSEKDPVVILNTTAQGINAADFEYIPSTNLLYIPTFNDNRVMAYEIINE